MKTAYTHEQIREKAAELFLLYGVNSASMDDIARLCGISKATIYQFFSGKDAIVYAVVENMIHVHNEVQQQARANVNDAIDEVLKQNAVMKSLCFPQRTDFFYQIEKFYPKS